MKEESEEPVGENEAISQEPFDDDLPCIRCGYNLRGLKSEGNCPECGAAIQKSLDFATERILCLACMKPNHPSAAVCSGCGSPMHTAGATASYFRTTAIGVRRRRDVDEETEAELAKLEARTKSKLMPRPTPAGFFMVALVAVPMAIMGVTLSIKIMATTGDVGEGICFMVFAGMALALLILPWRKYVKQRNAYIAWRNGFVKASKEPSAPVVKAAEPPAVDAGERDENLGDQPAG